MYLKNNLKKIILIYFIFFFSLFIFTYKINQSISLENDLGRDLYEITKISLGDFTLIGPKGSFGGLYTTPYYYYLFIPFFIFFNKNISGLLIFNSLLFSLSISIFVYFILKKFNFLKALFSGLILNLIPFIIYSGRNPGNAFTHIPLFIIFLTFLFFLDFKKISIKKIFLFSFFYGVIFFMQFSYLVIFIPMLILIFVILNKQIKKFLFFLLGFSFSLLPLIIFEIKNKFIMFKNTFINKSYLSFVNNTNLPNGIKISNNVYEKFIFLNNELSKNLNINFLVILLILLILLFIIKNLKIRFFILSSLLSFIFLFILLKYQYSNHYLLPFLTLFIFTFILSLFYIKYSFLVYISLLIFLILKFPKSYYQQSLKTPELISKRVNFVLKKNLINKEDKFNILFIRNDNIPSSLGYEYRYFLLLAGYRTLNEFEYPISKKLIIFDENFNQDLNNINTWELNEFNLKNSKIKKINNQNLKMTFYLIEK